MDAWFTVSAADGQRLDDARRRRLLDVLLLSVLALFIVNGAVRLPFTNEYMAIILSIPAALCLAGLVFLVNRYLSRTFAGLLFIILVTASVFVDLESVATGRSYLTFTIPIIVASFTLRPYAGLIAAGFVCCAVLAAQHFLFHSEIDPSQLPVFLFVALVAWVLARDLERALTSLQVVNQELDRRVEEELRQRTARLELLARIGQRMTAILELDELLGQATNLIHEAFGDYQSMILLIEGEELALRAATATALRARIGDMRVPISAESVAGRAAWSGELMREGDATSTELAVPIKLKGIVIGVLDVQSDRADAFSPADVSTLQAVADQLAITIESARLYEAAQREIVERRRAEKALRESEERYRQAVENSPNPIFSVDKDGAVQTWNRACEEVFRYGPEIIGQNYRKLLLNPEDYPVVEAKLSQVFQKRSLGDLDMYYRSQDGAERVTVSRLYPLFDGRGEVARCVFANTDITERMRAEEALRESEERYRTLVTQAPIGVVTFDRAGYVTHVNPAARRIVDLPADWEIGQTHLSDLSNLAAAGIAADVTRCVNEGVQIAQEYHALSLAHRESILRVRLTPLRDENGMVNGALAMMEDVTEQRRLEEQVIQSAKLASIGELAAGVAHEINNPINGIINYAQLLLNKASEEKRERRFLEGILREGDRVVNIVRDLLTFARVEKDARGQLTSLHDVLEATLTLTAQQLRQDGITLEIEEEPALPPVECHAQRIQQVFLNLISNARHALNARYAGGHPRKRLVICMKRVEIEERPHVRVIFRDYGIGIPAHHLPHVFTPFFTTKRPLEGTGLGLSVSYGIVRDHGGDIRVESIENEYTVFQVDLPINGFMERKEQIPSVQSVPPIR